MPKICMLTTSEIFHDSRILNEAKTLSATYDVVILARQYLGQRQLKLSYRIKLINFAKLKFHQLNIFSSLLSLMRAAFKENPDIYHAHDLDGLLCAFPAALLKRKKLIYDSHELWSDIYPFANLRGIRWLLPILEKFLMLKVKNGLTVNDSLARYLENKYKKNFIFLYNVSEKTPNKKLRIDLKRLFINKKIVLHLGSADEGRGMEQMIAAAKYFEKNMILVFIGGGKTEKQAQELVKKYHIKEKVRFLPAVLPDEIISTIKSADLGLALTQNISLSYYYSLPNKLFQYILAGVPILGSNFPEFRKIISKNGIGEVVNPANPELIAKKIIVMVKKSSQKKYRKKLYGITKSQYNWEVESKKLLNFYDKIFY